MPLPELLGRLHPLLVHLPIGILLYAVGLMIYGRVKQVAVEEAVSLAWGLGALSALMACGAGWLLAQSGEYDADIVTRHQWTGLATAGLSMVTFFLKQYRWPAALLTVGFLSVAGHFGGVLTHGDNYLFANASQMAATEPIYRPFVPTKSVAQQTDSVNQSNQPIIRRTFVYNDQVVPILKTKCYNCHSASKKKGGLRLDTEAFIRQGGKNGRILTAGNAQKSKLFTYLLLPEGDDMHMPPKGKLQLTPQQITAIYYWIQKGASFREQVEVIQPNSAALLATTPDLIPPIPTLSRADSGQQTVTNTEIRPVGVESALLARPVDAPNPAVLAKLKQQQIALSALTAGGNYLSANFINVQRFTPDLLTGLGELSQQLVHLRLSGQPVNNTDLTYLASLKNLTRLNLDHTRLTDDGLTALLALPNLEQLNLYGTAVTDKGLEVLARYPNLKVVYLWQTQTSQEGIRRLQQAHPNLKIETGTLQLAKIRPDTNKTL